MSKAAFALSEGTSAAQLKVALKYATIAKDGSSRDEKVQSHYLEVRAKHDEVVVAVETKAAP